MSLDHHHDEQGDELLKSEEFQKARREMRRVLWRPGVKPDQGVSITRRIFLNRALLAGTAAAAASARSGRDGDLQVRLDLRHPSLSQGGQHPLRREGGARGQGGPGDGSSRRLSDFRR
jgi:hypothetical protein